jgi:DAK2 domain fusion protein YloV
MAVVEQIDAQVLRDIIGSFREALHRHCARLNLLNVYPVPDGDTGTNMARTLDAVVEEINAAEQDFGATCTAISHGSLMGARGNSGVILSQILRGMTATFRDAADRSGETVITSARLLADALEAASSGAYRSVLTPVEGTILTVVRESAEAAQTAARRGEVLTEAVLQAYRAGADALERTPELLPVLKQAGVVDAGGAGFLLFLDAAVHVLTGREMASPEDVSSEAAAMIAAAVPGAEQLDGLDSADGAEATPPTGPRYEVMYFCDLADERIDDLKARWGEIGDSIVVVGGDGLWNCHVHTDQIGGAIEAVLDLGGRPSRIRVSDLFEEVAHEHRSRERSMVASSTPHTRDELDRVGCAVVAVSSGAGISEIFRSLGVRQVVGGGQSDNPSTAELLAAVEACAADEVIILPNNKNIVPVANQITELTSIPVHVVPTVSMPQALSALMWFESDCGVDHAAVEMAEAMSTAAAAVVTGEVTRAVRDSTSAAGPISAGDWLGLVRADGIVATGSEQLDVAKRVVDHVLGDDRELLTVLVGEDADQSALHELLEWLERSHPGVGSEVHHGGQPLYPFIFGAE